MLLRFPRRRGLAALALVSVVSLSAAAARANSADGLATCDPAPLSPALPAVKLIGDLAGHLAEENPRYALVLPDGREIILENVSVSDTRDAEEEAAKNPQLRAALHALPDGEDDDFETYQVAGKKRARYSNRGILSPKGAWPVAAGACTTISGRASFYGGGEKLKALTASGKRFNAGALSAAHRTLPLGTRVTMKNLNNGKIVSNVVIDDRGPALETGRSFDVTKGVAQRLGFVNAGHTNLEVRVCRGGSGGAKVGMLESSPALGAN